MSWDIVIVGGGSAGSVVAGRLAAAGRQVLVIEAGGTDRRPDVMIPAGVVSVYRTCNWRYVPEPDPSRLGAVEPWPAGRVLGGGGSINAGVFVRGNRADFDSWAQQGGDGWDYESVLPHFRSLETWHGEGSEFRGDHGPIHVAPHTNHHVANVGFHEAAQQAGHAANPDYNGRAQDGVGMVQVNQRRGLRCQASRAYLRRNGTGRDGAATRPTIVTHAQATRVVFDGDRAVGVEYRRRGRTHIARARHEVVLSAGTFISPKLLMLSGIGPRDDLRRLGIDVRVDSPAVGANLREHATIMLRWNATVPTLNTLGALDGLKALRDWIAHGTGIVAATVMHVQVMHRTDPAAPAPNAQICFANFATVREVTADGMLKIKPATTDGFLVAITLVHPRTRGRLSLRSRDPFARPVIEHALLGDSRDVGELIDGMAEARRIMAQPAIGPFVSGMFEPEASLRSHADWESFLRGSATYGAHAIGTCRLGSAVDGAVVDPALRVHGVRGLRVIDASVMPSHPSGNTNAASMMIGEKGAELILRA